MKTNSPQDVKEKAELFNNYFLKINAPFWVTTVSYPQIYRNSQANVLTHEFLDQWQC